MQGVVLASFFYGYVTTQIPGGMMAQKFGGKRLLLFGIFWTSALTILTPVITHYGDFPAIVITRIFEGIGEVCCVATSTREALGYRTANQMTKFYAPTSLD